MDALGQRKAGEGGHARLSLNRPGFHAVFVLAASPVGEPVW